MIDSVFPWMQQPQKNHEQWLRDSIRNNLRLILNARAGSVKHLPLFGLPDVTEIYQNLPYSLDKLTAAIYRAIQQFEPRISGLTVVHQTMKETDCVLQLEISGRLIDGGLLKLQTLFMSDGHAQVQ